MDEQPSFFTVAEVAKLLRVRAETVYEWCRDGELLAIRVGRYWRIDRPAVECLLANGGVAPAPLAAEHLR